MFATDFAAVHAAEIMVQIWCSIFKAVPTKPFPFQLLAA
jgi:hypothetical protein